MPSTPRPNTCSTLVGRSLLIVALMVWFHPLIQAEPPADFDGSISREVLEQYLARAVTHTPLCGSDTEPVNRYLDDDIRMLTRIGAKFIGRAALQWATPTDFETFFEQAGRQAARVHEADPQMILQAAILECLDDGVNRVAIPPWVFEAFDLKPEERHFQYEAMLFDGGQFRDFWLPGWSVPDISKIETRLYFYWRAARFIDLGFEAIHFGQIEFMGQNDPDFHYWDGLLTRVRTYARTHARRRMVLCDGHTHGRAIDGRLLFDFHSYPLRIGEVVERTHEGVLAVGRLDSIYGRSLGGIAPSGWKCDHLPYLVEMDNFGKSGKGGEILGAHWIWGWDEIDWFARQGEDARNRWLRYAWDWVRQNDPNGFFQIPTRRILHDPADNRWEYHANRPSEACPPGFNQEDAILGIWSENPEREG